MENEVLKKWGTLIEACKRYYIDSLPTGLTDSEYDSMERQALQEDNFSVRDYVFEVYSKGTKVENKYIEKIKKTKADPKKTMFQSIVDYTESLGRSDIYCNLKYDGSSIAIYLDPTCGKPKRIVTSGNLNLSSQGIDQTWKLIDLIPRQFPLGILAIQCEALVDVSKLENPDRARQKANGLINSKYLESEVKSLLTLRAYRYYTDDTPAGISIRESDYREVLQSFGIVRSMADGHIMFAPADTWSLEELYKMPGYTETDCTVTSTGKFLNDGYVIYDKHGICLGAIKFAGAGSTSEDTIKTVVKSIQWNNQVLKGKDSWSANVLIEPVTIRGCTTRKPSAGSVSKLVKENITPGAEVSIILANSTIPMVGTTWKPGNGDYMWPTCSCGYKMSEKDIYGSLLKCGNPCCSERLERMRNYLSGLSSPGDLDLNKLLVIDRFKWENTKIDINILLSYVSSGDQSGYHNYLEGFLKTDLQKRNLNLVWEPSWIALYERIHV